MHPKELGRIVKSAREEKGLSQADLGRAIGVKQQSIDAIGCSFSSLNVNMWRFSAGAPHKTGSDMFAPPASSKAHLWSSWQNPSPGHLPERGL